MSSDFFAGMMFAVWLWLWVPKLIEAWKLDEWGLVFMIVLVAFVGPLVAALGLF